MKKIMLFFAGILILSLIGCNSPIVSKTPNTENFITTENIISEKELNTLISNCLKNDIGLSIDNNSKVFESHELIGTEFKNNTVICYIKAFVNSYKIENDKACESSGGEFTGIIYVKKINNHFKVTKHNFPIESTEANNLFPKKMLPKLNSIELSNLISKTETNANNYFKEHNIKLVNKN